MNARPLRFTTSGTNWGPSGVDQRTYLRAEAQAAEKAGFDVLTYADHLMPGCRPALGTVLCAAEATSTLRFATMVLNNDFWNPVLLAREALTLASLTGNRFELGLGAGHAKSEYLATGIAFCDSKQRVARLEESLVILRALFCGETVTHHGAHFSLSDAETHVPDVAKLRVPILVGGNAKRVMQLAGRYGDAVGLTGLVRNLEDGHVHQPDWSPDYLDSRIQIVREAAGSRFAEIELQALVQSVVETDDREAAATKICNQVRNLGVTLSPADAMATPFLLFGTINEMAASIRAARDRWGITCYTTRPDGTDVMRRVIAAVKASGASTT